MILDLKKELKGTGCPNKHGQLDTCFLFLILNAWQREHKVVYNLSRVLQIDEHILDIKTIFIY